MTPDTTRSERDIEMLSHVTEALEAARHAEDAIASGQLITLADHEAAVAKAKTDDVREAAEIITSIRFEDLGPCGSTDRVAQLHCEQAREAIAGAMRSRGTPL